MMDTAFYVIAGVWAVGMVVILIKAIRLSYQVEYRSPDLVNRTGLPQRTKIFHTATNWKVARDDETQALRRRMNRLLLVNLAGFALFWVILKVFTSAAG